MSTEQKTGMKFEWWYLFMGGLLIVAALMASVVKRLPFTATMLYLGIGVLLGPLALDVASIDPLTHADILERAAELAVIVSLSTAGLKLRAPFWGGPWNLPLRLAFLSMALTVGMIAVVAVFGFGLPWGAAVLLGAVLAPTDPVLASEVQLESAIGPRQTTLQPDSRSGNERWHRFSFCDARSWPARLA